MIIFIYISIYQVAQVRNQASVKKIAHYAIGIRVRKNGTVGCRGDVEYVPDVINDKSLCINALIEVRRRLVVRQSFASNELQLIFELKFIY